MGPLGMGEIVVIFVLALLIFGPKKLPELGKTFGKGMAEFKRASNELKSTFQREMDNIDHETRDVKDLARTVQGDINTSYYDDNEDDYYSDYNYGGNSGSSSSSSSGDSTAGAKEGDASFDSGQASEQSANDSAAGHIETSGNDTETVLSGDEAPVSGLPDSEEVAPTQSA